MSEHQMYAEIMNLLDHMCAGRPEGEEVRLTADESLVLARLTGRWLKTLGIQPSDPHPSIFDDAVKKHRLVWEWQDYVEHVHNNADGWAVFALGAWQGVSVRLRSHSGE